MEQLLSDNLNLVKDQLQEIVKPYQQEQNQRQKKADFLKMCIKNIEKDDFFQLDELLKSKLSKDILDDPYFISFHALFDQMRTFADDQIEKYRIQYKEALLHLAEEAQLPLTFDFPRISILKGIEGKIDFAKRCTTINQATLKSIDPRKIISMAIKIKRKLYDTAFNPQQFINSLFNCYKKILSEKKQESNHIVGIRQLYSEYALSLQSKAFLQNMEKGKFKGYPLDQFAVDLWKFFQSDVSSTEEGYLIRLNPGRGQSLWLIDPNGEKRQITHVDFLKG